MTNTSFFSESVTEFTEELTRIQGLTEAMSPANDEHLAALAKAIKEMSSQCLKMESQILDPTALKAAQKEFQDAIDPWFRLSSMMDRARRKPRGYPGDYEMLNGIYSRQPKGTGIGGYLDLYFIEADLGRAVRARMEAARQFLSQAISQSTGSMRIINVACGPCEEYFVGLDYPEGREVEIVCIDADDEAMDYVKNRIQQVGGLRPAVEFVNYNALRMRSAKKNIDKFGEADLIYSIGLMDYIPDKHLVPILSGLRETLKSGGTLFVAFKDELLYDKAEYQWFVDWFFFQRGEGDCRRLMLEAGFDDNQIEVTRDETRIIMNFNAKVPSGSAVRVDPLGHVGVPGINRNASEVME